MRGFVGTYTSRYSDHDGYWIFGLVGPHLDGWSVDLLSEASQLVPSHLAAAMELATRRFREQLAKARLPLSVVREATLTVARKSSERGPVHGHYTAGHRFRFCVRVASDRGYTLHDEATIFVAPHDPRYEPVARAAPNQAMEPTTGRRTPKIPMAPTSHLAATRALASGGSSCSR